MKATLSLLSFFLVFSIGSAANAIESTVDRKVLLVGIDGCQYRKLIEADTPHLDQLHFSRGYTGGIIGTANEQVTVSGPAWTTILTGKWADKHGVESNKTSWRAKEKSVFRIIKEAHPDAYVASIITWKPIHQFIEADLEFIDYATYINEKEEDPSIAAIEQIKEKGPDFIFSYLGNVDTVGHAKGFGPEYQAAIETADEQFGRLRAAVDARAAATGEAWLIIVVTDHGRRIPEGKAHGQPTLSEKTIFFALNRPGGPGYGMHEKDFEELEMHDLYSYPPQTSTTPTILDFLGLLPKEKSEFDGPSLLR